MTLTIAPLDVGRDATRIVELQRAAYTVEAMLLGFDGLPPLHERVEDVRGSHEHFFGASVDGELVGVTSFQRVGSVCEIGRLGVHPVHARRGIGRSLLQEIFRQNRVGVIAVETALTNAPALALYVSEGFCEVARWPAAGASDLQLVRLLRQ